MSLESIPQMNKEDVRTELYTIPVEKCAAVLGKHNKKIKEISRTSGASCQLQQPPKNESNNRFIKICGTEIQIQTAQKLIEDTLLERTENNTGPPNEKKKKNFQNQPGQGVNYEVVVPAWIALKLFTNPDVTDFRLQMNENPSKDNKKKTTKDNFKFDDVIIDITTKQGETLNFAVQLKHAENEDINLQPQNFFCGKEAKIATEQTGNFVLNMYCKSSFCDAPFTDCVKSGCQKQNCQDIHCTVPNCRLSHRKIVQIERQSNILHYILFTNKRFDPQKSGKVEAFKMERNDNCKGAKYLNSDSKCGAVYLFSTSENTLETENVKKEDYDMFFKNFSLYVNQKNARGIEKEIEGMFQDHFKSPNSAANYIAFFKRCHDNAYENREVDKAIIGIQLIELLLPPEKLFFKEDEDLVDFIQLTKQKKVTIIDGDFKHLFHEDTKYVQNEINDDFVSLVKRKKLIEQSDNSELTYILIKALFYCHEWPIIITNDNDALSSIDKAIKLTTFIDKIHFVIIGKNINLTEVSGTNIFKNLKNVYDQDRTLCYQILNNLTIYLRQNKPMALRDLIKTDETIYEFITTATIIKMLKKQYYVDANPDTQSDSYVSRKIKFGSQYVQDSKIFEEVKISDYEAKGYLLCGKPGSGKTELLKRLSRICPFGYFTIYFNLKNVPTVVQTDSKHADVLDVILKTTSNDINNSLESKLKKKLKDEKLVLFFFDALDESFDKVSARHLLKQVQEKGFCFWVGSRDSMKKYLKKELKVEDLEIKELDISDQKEYIKQKLSTNKDAIKIVDEIDKIRQTRTEHEQLLALPLNLDMLIKMVDKNRNENHLLGNKFVVTDMYHPLIEENFSHYLKKKDIVLPDEIQTLLEYPEKSTIILPDKIMTLLKNLKEQNSIVIKQIVPFLKDYFWQQYENVALEDCFGSRVRVSRFNSIYYQDFKKYIIKNKEDPLGIICEENDRSLGFVHRTYAEFFVASWIVKNFEHETTFKNVIFEEQYANIRYFLDLELAKRKPIFLAVIHKNLEEIVGNRDKIFDVDKGGRNVLHLACSQMPSTGTDSIEEKIVDRILSLCTEPTRLNTQDSLYNLTPVEYCEKFKYLLYVVILRRHRFQIKEETLYNVLDFTISENHVSVLNELCRDCGPLVSDYMESHKDALFVAVHKNYLKIVVLLQDKVDLEIEDASGRTVLYYAIRKGYHEIVSSLIASGANTGHFSNQFTPLQLSAALGDANVCVYLTQTCQLNVDDVSNGFAPLHVAILHHHTDLVKVLVKELGADVNAICQSASNLEPTGDILLEILGNKWEQVKSDEARTVLDLAVDCGYVDCVEFLLEKEAISIKYPERAACLKVVQENFASFR